MPVYAAIEAAAYLLIFIIGACVGSLANVLISRLPKELPIVRGFSFCPACEAGIKPYDLIPILRRFISRGECKRCHAPIPPRYTFVEAASGALAVLAVYYHGYGMEAVCSFLIFITLLVISFIDAEHMIIPDALVIALAVLTGFLAVFEPNGAALASRVIGFIVLSLPMLLLTFFIPGAFGGGDIKLIAVCGLLLGAKLTLLAGFLAIMLGGIYGMYAKYVQRTAEKHIAFGQFLCAGVFIAMLWGNDILNWYFSRFIA